MLTYYTNRFVPASARGCCRGFVIFIRPQYKNDRGLLEHEKVHRKQWLRTLGLHSFCYAFVKECRLDSEVEAFNEQAKWYDDDRLPHFAKLIATRYNLRVTEAEALDLLKAA
jgi:hypothetical protein